MEDWTDWAEIANRLRTTVRRGDNGKLLSTQRIRGGRRPGPAEMSLADLEELADALDEAEAEIREAKAQAKDSQDEVDSIRGELESAQSRVALLVDALNEAIEHLPEGSDALASAQWAVSKEEEP